MFDWLITLLGVMVGAVFAFKELGSSPAGRVNQRIESSPTNDVQIAPAWWPSVPEHTQTPVTPRWLDDSLPDMPTRPFHEANVVRGGLGAVLPWQRQGGNGVVNGRDLLENWRRSLIGLVRLAEKNLQAAECQATMMNYRMAGELAATSVENVSRALLHCYGEKPEQAPGQEESLRLLARRFQGEEKAQFERTIGETVQPRRNKIVQGYLWEKGIQVPLLSQQRTREALDTATRIVAQFRRIIDEHFATEIPELGERCPKCSSLSVSLWAFGAEGSHYQCSSCRHRWMQPG